MQFATKLAILLVTVMALAGEARPTPGLAVFALLAAGALALLQRFGPGLGARKRQAWLKAMLRHREALTRRFRQTVRANAYGYEEMGKWVAELERFRRSIRLDLGEADIARFDALATRTIRRWAEAAAAPSSGEADIAAMTPEDYEHFCADALRAAGWDAEVTGMAGDQGVDVAAERDGLRLAVQCKLHFANPVGNKAVQEAHAAAGFIEAHQAVVVSNGDYTRAAADLADKLGVLLVHHADLADLDGLIGRSRRTRLAALGA